MVAPLVFKGALAWLPKASALNERRRHTSPASPLSSACIAARIAHGDSPHTVRALRGDLGELCGVPRAAGDDAGDLRQRAAAPLAGTTRRAPARARHDRPPAVVGARAVRRSRAPRRARGRSLARARRPAPAPAACPTRSPPPTARRCSTATGTRTCAACAIARSSSCCTAAACAPARSARSTLASYDAVAGRLRVIGKGDRERIVPVGEPAREALDEWLRDGRPACRRCLRALLLSVRGRRALAVRRAQGARAPLPHRRRQRALAARAAARLRYTSVGGGRRFARDPGAARPRIRRDDADLCARRRSRISCASTPTTTPEDDGCRNHPRRPSTSPAKSSARSGASTRRRATARCATG